MKKRTALIAALMSLLSLGGPLLIGTGAAFTSAAVILSVPEMARAESAEFYLIQAKQLLLDKNNKESISMIFKALSIKESSEGYFLLGHAYRNSRQLEAALNAFKRSLELEPDISSVYQNLGAVSGDLGEHQNAITYLNKALELNPKHPLAYLGRGISKGRLGMWNEGIEDFNIAIMLDPKLANAYLNRGIANLNLNNLEVACLDFRQALSLDDKYAFALKNYQHPSKLLHQHCSSQK